MERRDIRDLQKKLSAIKLAEEKRLAEAKRVAEAKRRAEAEAKRQAEEKRLAAMRPFAKTEFPLKGKIHTPIKLYKNLMSGLSMDFYNPDVIVKNYKVKLLWENTLLPIEEDGFLIKKVRDFEENNLSHLQPGDRKYIYFNADKQMKIIDVSYDYEYKYKHKYAFLLGVQIKFEETENIKVQTYIEKFKKDYPNLKQSGSFPKDRTLEEISIKITDRDITSLKAKIKERCQIAKEKADELIGANIYRLSPGERLALNEKVREMQSEVANQVVEEFVQGYPKEKAFEIKLCNNDVVISFTKIYNRTTPHVDYRNKNICFEYYYSGIAPFVITIKDIKLLAYREQIEKDLICAIKEYNKKGMEKQKKKELQQLNF